LIRSAFSSDEPPYFWTTSATGSYLLTRHAEPNR
jgi:hypothetical protein